MHVPLATACLLVAAACSRQSAPPPAAAPHTPPEPPAGTGIVPIVMDGEWQVVDVVRLDGLPSLPNPVPGAPPFVPVQTGQVLRVAGGLLLDDTNAPLFAPAAIEAHDFYANTTDGRTLWFEVNDFDAAAPAHFSVQAIFGSSGPDEITGFVSVLLVGAPYQGQFVMTEPDGSFLVRATRVPPRSIDQPAVMPSSER